MLNPSQKRHILDSSKLKEFADDNFQFDENGVKFSERVENTARKRQIARYEQYLLFPLWFQKTFTTYILPFPRRQILDSSKLKEFADDNFFLI